MQTETLLPLLPWLEFSSKELSWRQSDKIRISHPCEATENIMSLLQSIQTRQGTLIRTSCHLLEARHHSWPIAVASKTLQLSLHSANPNSPSHRQTSLTISGIQFEVIYSWPRIARKASVALVISLLGSKRSKEALCLLLSSQPMKELSWPRGTIVWSNRSASNKTKSC